MRIKLAAIALAAVSTAALANEQSSPADDTALSGLRDEIATCIAFHTISESLFSRPPQPPGWEAAVIKSRQMSKGLINSAIQIMRRMEQDPENLGIMVGKKIDRLQVEMGHNRADYPMLLEKYLTRCNAISIEVETRHTGRVEQSNGPE